MKLPSERVMVWSKADSSRGPRMKPMIGWPGRELEPAHPVAEDAEQDEAEDAEQALVDGVGADKGEDGSHGEDDA